MVVAHKRPDISRRLDHVGLDAMPLTVGYASLMAPNFGGAFTNYAVSGYQAAVRSWRFTRTSVPYPPAIQPIR